MGANASHHSCFGQREDGFDTRSSITSSHQQSVIIDQLRISLKKKEKSTHRDGDRKFKIVPSGSATSSLGYPDEFLCDERQSSVLASMEEPIETDLNRPYSNTYQNLDLNEERCLKSALTHPTVLTFLRSFMTAQGNNDSLEFYLDVAEIRGLTKERYYKEAYELWLKVISMYVLDGAPCPVRMLSRHREMILGNFTSNPQSTDLVKSGNLNPAQHSGSRSASLSNCKINSVNLDKNVLEGLRRAQYVTFITIKTDSWIPFSDSDIYKCLLLKKEIRTTLVLPGRTTKLNIFQLDRSLSFASIYGSENGTLPGTGRASYQGGTGNEGIVPSITSEKLSVSDYLYHSKLSLDLISPRSALNAVHEENGEGSTKGDNKVIQVIDTATTTTLNSPIIVKNSPSTSTLTNAVGTAASSSNSINTDADKSNDENNIKSLTSNTTKQTNSILPSISKYFKSTKMHRMFFLKRGQRAVSSKQMNKDSRLSIQIVANNNMAEIQQRQQRQQLLLQGQRQGHEHIGMGQGQGQIGTGQGQGQGHIGVGQGHIGMGQGQGQYVRYQQQNLTHDENMTEQQQHQQFLQQQRTPRGVRTSSSKRLGYEHSLRQGGNGQEDNIFERQPYKLWSSRNAQLILKSQQQGDIEGHEDGLKKIDGCGMKENENRRGSCNLPGLTISNRTGTGNSSRTNNDYKHDYNNNKYNCNNNGYGYGNGNGYGNGIGNLSARSNASGGNYSIRSFITPRSSKYTARTDNAHSVRTNNTRSVCTNDVHSVLTNNTQNARTQNNQSARTNDVHSVRTDNSHSGSITEIDSHLNRSSHLYHQGIHAVSPIQKVEMSPHTDQSKYHKNNSSDFDNSAWICVKNNNNSDDNNKSATKSYSRVSKRIKIPHYIDIDIDNKEDENDNNYNNNDNNNIFKTDNLVKNTTTLFSDISMSDCIDIEYSSNFDNDCINNRNIIIEKNNNNNNRNNKNDDINYNANNNNFNKNNIDKSNQITYDDYLWKEEEEVKVNKYNNDMKKDNNNSNNYDNNNYKNNDNNNNNNNGRRNDNNITDNDDNNNNYNDINHVISIDNMRNVKTHNNCIAYVSARSSKLLATEGMEQGFSKFFE